jgi:hypothetical protein
MAADYTGAGMLVLAERYGVSQTTIHHILSGKHVLTAGLPKVSGRRRSLVGGTAWGSGTSRATPRQLRAAGLTSARVRLPRADRKRMSCPRCGAKPGEACTNPRAGSYPRPLQGFHRERRPAEGGSAATRPKASEGGDA